MRFSKIVLGLAAVASLAAVPVVRADSIVDGSFTLTPAETAAGTPYATSGYAYGNPVPIQSITGGTAPVEDFSSTGFTFTSLSGIAKNGNIGLTGAPTPQAAFLQSFQNYAEPVISDTFTAATGLYLVKFQAEASNLGGVTPESFQASLNGFSLNVTPVTGAFQSYSFYVPVLTGGSETLSFTGTGGGGNQISFIDNVSVQSVPLPSPMLGCAALLAGMAAWGVYSRKPAGC